MNLIFRLIAMWIAAHLGRPIALAADGRIAFRCMPHDLDLNWHMTNSRYHSFMDLARVDFMIRNGAWGKLRGAGFAPVLGSSSIRFRRAIRPLQRFEITTRIASWDERWMYLEQRFHAGGETAAIAVMKTTFLSKTGRVPTEQLVQMMGWQGPRPTFTEVLAAKDNVDRLLVV
jgi:acyl-CoA thioesterase FadM